MFSSKLSAVLSSPTSSTLLMKIPPFSGRPEMWRPSGRCLGVSKSHRSKTVCWATPWWQDGSRHLSLQLHPPAYICFSLVVVKAGGMAVISQPLPGLEREDPVISCMISQRKIGWSFISKTSQTPSFLPRPQPWRYWGLLNSAPTQKSQANGIVEQQKRKPALFSYSFCRRPA